MTLRVAGSVTAARAALGATSPPTARTPGIDHDFGRGNSAYDRYYGDPLSRPNPNLGTIEKAPFVAGDLGTKGGIVTDGHARALRADGTVIEGLYSAGNCSASVMGRTYPAPVSTLGRPRCSATSPPGMPPRRAGRPTTPRTSTAPGSSR